MCVLYVNFRSKVRPRTIGCMGSAVLCEVQIACIIHRVWSEESAICLSGFSVRLL